MYPASLGADFAKTVSGAFLKHPHIGFSILVNLNMTPGRRRFTVAHELGHALFHSDVPYLVSTASKSPRERFADAFAGEFLMPTEGLRRVTEEQGYGPRIEDPSEVIHLQRFFGVSYVTALVRLRQAKFLTRARLDAFKLVRPVLLARALGYEISDEESSPHPELWRLERFPQRFRRLLRLAVRHGVLSVPSAAALTQLPLDEITELVSADVTAATPLAKNAPNSRSSPPVVSSASPKSVVDTVVLRYFLLVDEIDLLVELLGSPIGAPRIVVDGLTT